jgi:hypothetical protein
VTGHGVASGRADDPRFPEGTLAEQFPLFAAEGVDLHGYQRATLNIAVDGALLLDRPDATVTLDWTPHLPPETFSFLACVVEVDGNRHDAMIYQPHPETKTDHHQPDNVVEVLAPPLGALEGRSVVLEVDGARAHLERHLAY